MTKYNDDKTCFLYPIDQNNQPELSVDHHSILSLEADPKRTKRESVEVRKFFKLQFHWHVSSIPIGPSWTLVIGFIVAHVMFKEII